MSTGMQTQERTHSTVCVYSCDYAPCLPIDELQTGQLNFCNYAFYLLFYITLVVVNSILTS